MITDVHTHVVLDGLAPVEDPLWPVLRTEDGKRYLVLATGRRRDVPDTSVDMRARLREMDARGVGRHVLSPMPAQLADVVQDPRVAMSAARAVNDALAGYVAVNPARLSGLGTLPVAEVDVIEREVARCVNDLGLLGFELSSEAFFRLVEQGSWPDVYRILGDAGVWLLVHPQDDALARRRGVHGRLAIAGVAMMTETALVAVEMMRLGTVGPSGPKIILAHGGGTLPFVLGRLDKLWETTDARREVAERPSTLFQQAFFLDTCVHDGGSLALVAAKAAQGRLLFGSDYPFAIGVSPTVIVEAGIESPEDVLWRNAHAAGISAWGLPAASS